MKLSATLVSALTVIGGDLAAVPSTAKEVGNEHAGSLRGRLLLHQGDIDTPLSAGNGGNIASEEEFKNIATRSLYTYIEYDLNAERTYFEAVKAGGSSNRAPCPWKNSGAIPGTRSSEGTPETPAPGSIPSVAEGYWNPPFESFCDSDESCISGCCASGFRWECDGGFHEVKCCSDTPGACQ